MLELVLSMTIIGLLLPSIFALYTFIMKSNKEIVARQNAIQQWYEFFERLNILMEDYTIDYEEYYNRQMVGCVWDSKRWGNFERNVEEGDAAWNCTGFTAYGNSYTNGSELENGYNIYYCSTTEGNKRGKHKSETECGRYWRWQSYWQYAALFTDAHDYTSDEDDEELWCLLKNWNKISHKCEGNNIDAIADANKIQELYLISHDWKRRLYFRRKNVEADPTKEPHYKIQILRLRWFDAWEKHNFSDTSSSNKWLYDWVLDTRACDYSMWFEPIPEHKNNSNCSHPNSEGNSVCWAYSDYYLPQDADDCWVDFTQWSTNVSDWQISISPIGDADLYWADQSRQINAYMRIMTVNSIYGPALFSEWTVPESIKEFKVPLQTTINMKDFYRGYSE